LLIIAIMPMFFYVQRSSANEFIRNLEILECKQNELLTWGDGSDRAATANKLRFAYAPTNSPNWFKEGQIIGMAQKAAEAWSQCGIDSRVIVWRPGIRLLNREIIIIQWNEKESRGNFALANLTKRTLSLNPKMFELLRTRNPAYDASQTLQMTISHEMGHFFGLMAHSRRCVDVMSYYTNNKGDKCFSRAPMSESHVVEYRNILPTACDIKRCRQINGKPPLPEPSR